MNENNATFEQNMARLEQIVRTLERGDAPLEESLKLFEEGTGLVRSCGALLDAWSEIRGREAEGGVWSTRGDGFLSVFDLERGLEELAAFAGCRVNLSRDRVYPGGMEGISWTPTRVRCYSPRLLEALSLFLMTGAGTLSTDRQVNCRLATRGEGCHLLLFLE
jgi:exodeoxyribonuclease VII small subunit